MKADGTPDLENLAFEPPHAQWNVQGARAVRGRRQGLSSFALGGWRCILRGIMLLPLTYAPQSLGFVCTKWGICVRKVGDLCALPLTYAPLPLSYGRARPRLRFGLVASLWVATTLKGRIPVATAAFERRTSPDTTLGAIRCLRRIYRRMWATRARGRRTGERIFDLSGSLAECCLCGFPAHSVTSLSLSLGVSRHCRDEARRLGFLSVFAAAPCENGWVWRSRGAATLL